LAKTERTSGFLAPFHRRILRDNEPSAGKASAAPPSIMRFRTLPPLLVLAAIVAAIPAAAQFYPPRPPRDVDTAPDDQPPPQYPQYPSQPAPRQYPQQYPQQYPPAGGGVQSAPLPPPPGASQPLPPSGRDQPLPQQGQQRVPAQKGAPGTATVPDPNAPMQPAPKGKQKAAKQPDQPGQPEAAEVPVQQEPIRRLSNPTAVFSGLDKITGRIITFEVAMDETVQFGALQVTPHVCYTRAATEIQNTTSFVDVDEITLQGDIKRIFTGWMFANSPGLHGVEHPIYDVWVTDCKTTPPAMAASGGKK
jgi:hypothetical protein